MKAINRVILAALLPAAAYLIAGCRKPVHFPMEGVAGAAGAARAYDTDGDGRADFFQYRDAAGRIAKIAYDRDGDGRPDETVDLDAIDFARCRHLVLILDGFAYDLVKKAYDAGALRMFHPPSRVVAPYPTLTDPALEDLLAYSPCPAFEARYYDRGANRAAGGSGDYMAGKNAPYNQLLQYRAAMLWDALGYLYPWEVFGKELNDAKRLFDRGRTQEVLAYFVSSAGVGTRMGAEGQRKALQRVEQFVNQVIWETRGLTKVTLLADHGHSYTEARRIPLEKHLKDRGWKLRESLKGPKDVVYIRFGLETYASFATQSREALAKDLAAAEGVELASFAAEDAVVVLAPKGQRAVIRRRGARFRYQRVSGDPLGLRPILAKLKPDAAGYFDADELLSATLTHTWPAPLQRLWRAHFALVANPPDVIVSLADNFYSGDTSLAGAVSIASTHGSLNYSNSVTFIMSTIGPLPPYMRSRDVPGHMKTLTGRHFPAGK